MCWIKYVYLLLKVPVSRQRIKLYLRERKNSNHIEILLSLFKYEFQIKELQIKLTWKMDTLFTTPNKQDNTIWILYKVGTLNGYQASEKVIQLH